MYVQYNTNPVPPYVMYLPTAEVGVGVGVWGWKEHSAPDIPHHLRAALLKR